MKLSAALAFGIVVPLLVGCHDHDDPHVVAAHGQFTFDAIVDNYTEIEQYRWNTPFEDAFVDFEAVDFRGEIRLEILDDHDAIVYDVTFVGDGGEFFFYDETDRGDPGEWIVIITSTDVDGHVFIRLH